MIGIIAGIMPITSMPGMRKMAELALGARYPAPLLRALNRTGGDEQAVRRVGVHWATEQFNAAVVAAKEGHILDSKRLAAAGMMAHTLA